MSHQIQYAKDKLLLKLRNYIFTSLFDPHLTSGMQEEMWKK